MSDESSSFNLSFLSPSTFNSGSTSRAEIKLVSTPINSKKNANELSPVDLDEITKNSNPRTPNSKNDVKQDKLHSILKSGRNKSPSRRQLEEYSITESLLKKHPELKLAAKNGDINPVKGARVIFSPTKEVLSYRNDYFDDYSEEESVSNLRKIRKNKSKNNYDEDCTIDLTNDNNNDNKDTATEAKEKTSILSKIVSDPNIPYVLSLYLQLLFNLLLIGTILYLLFIFIRTIKSDISHKLETYTSDAIQEISLCSREYYRNKCSIEDGQTRVPALEKACTMWSKCMNRDPQLIGKSKITAETFADIVNGFVKPITWKSLFFMNFMIFGSLFITNIALGSYRNSSAFTNASKKELTEMQKEYEKKFEEQNKLLLEYRNQLRDQNDTSMNNTNSFITTYAGNTPNMNRIHPSQSYNQIMLHDHNNTHSYASPVLNRNNPYK